MGSLADVMRRGHTALTKLRRLTTIPLWASSALDAACCLSMAQPPNGFEYKLVGDEVVISHNGRRATTLRGGAADQFRVEVEDDDPQELMARLTGNYKHGNERTAKNHPRNRRR